MAPCRSASLLLAALCLTGCHHGNGLTPLPGSAHPEYTITDLGRGMPHAINDHGQVAGYVIAGYLTQSKASPFYHGFLWDNGKRTEMPTLGGSYSFADSIDNAGRVLGTATVAGGEVLGPAVTRHCLWEGATLTDLDSDPRFEGAQTLHLTNSGAIYAASPPQPQNGGVHLWFYPQGLSSGPRIDRGKIGGQSLKVTAVNDRGSVIGLRETGKPGSARQAFLWHSGDSKETALSPLSEAEFTVTALNDAGQIIGRTGVVGGTAHAFLWQKGTLRDLGTLPEGKQSFAYALNASGQVVGTSDTANSGLEDHAVLWDHGKLKDLSQLIPAGTHWSQIRTATGINAQGQIVGEGLTDDGLYTHGFLLTPIPTAR